ncbi:AraC family transcriptional regulator [Neptunitalea lumnitzerae]|uniref:AraC family transcriptional regulator n=1 Tax=Neptunitalea lumnitzerae TaxID=2965509 RepID=A0ABQ5MEL8_9FLAO|nr:GyrI-like domain-containing protein [Neptunitalea sp. Y10]GLB47808.1 AraC family transcriptional regulator [Neptunitalea sp. Y10]
MANLQHLTTEYQNRMNAVFKYIDTHLNTALTLEVVAEIAIYSPYHFHRIFKVITGEPLTVYINRRRLEKAAADLMHKPDIAITELALQYGFSSNSSFTRAFKKFYGVSPSTFRVELPGKFSKIRQPKSKNGQPNFLFERYLWSIQELKNWIDMNAHITTVELPELQIAYVTAIGHTKVKEAYQQLIHWATPRELMQQPETKMITVYHDSFKVTDPDKVRISAGIKVPKNTKTEGAVATTTLPANKYIKGCFTITLAEFEKAWSSLFIWMNEKGYKKADANPFEIYHNDFRTHPEQKCIVDLYIPIQKAI